MQIVSRIVFFISLILFIITIFNKQSLLLDINYLIALSLTFLLIGFVIYLFKGNLQITISKGSISSGILMLLILFLIILFNNQNISLNNIVDSMGSISKITLYVVIVFEIFISIIILISAYNNKFKYLRQTISSIIYLVSACLAFITLSWYPIAVSGIILLYTEKKNSYNYTKIK
jgi:hypothetical protein